MDTDILRRSHWCCGHLLLGSLLLYIHCNSSHHKHDIPFAPRYAEASLQYSCYKSTRVYLRRICYFGRRYGKRVSDGDILYHWNNTTQKKQKSSRLNVLSFFIFDLPPRTKIFENTTNSKSNAVFGHFRSDKKARCVHRAYIFAFFPSRTKIFEDKAHHRGQSEGLLT